MSLTGKVALVSGAGGGICRAIALAFAKAGASVACCDIDPDSSEETARLVTEAGGRALSQACDVASEKDTLAIAAAAGTISVSHELEATLRHPFTWVDSVAKGKFPVPFDQYTWTTTSSPISDPNGLYDIHINVNWSSGSYLLRTYRFIAPRLATRQ